LKTKLERPTYSAVIPDEPPMLSVVLDATQRVWQHRGRDNYGGRNWLAPYNQASPDAVGALSWAQLLNLYGPVTELHRPQED
jgi:hypothetical protein